MKILLFNTLYYPTQYGGAEKSVQLLAEGLHNKGHQVTVVSLTENTEDSGTNNGVSTIYIPNENIYWPFSSGKNSRSRILKWQLIESFNRPMEKKVSEVIRRIQPDIIHTNNLLGITTAPWIAAKRNKIPTVHTLRDYNMLCINSTMYRSDSICTTRCTTCIVLTSKKKRDTQTVTSVVGNSDYILQRHLSLGYFSNSKKSVIFSGTPKVSDIPKGTLPNKFTIGMIGLISKIKGFEMALEAICRTPSADYKIVVAGKGEQSYVEYLKNRFPGVEFIGYSTQKEFYTMIDVLIVPSLWPEPLSRTILEAYSYGIPVIASSTGGSTEVIKHGSTGYLFDVDDFRNIRNYIEIIIKNQEHYRELSNNAKDLAESYSIDNSVDAYTNLYRTLVYSRLKK